MKTQTKAIKIDVQNRTLTHVTLDNWRDIAPAIGNDCRLFAVPEVLPNNDGVYCDDEGLYNELIGGFALRGMQYMIVGNGLIIGADEEGESTDAQTPIEILRDHIVFFTAEEAERYANNVM